MLWLLPIVPALAAFLPLTAGRRGARTALAVVAVSAMLADLGLAVLAVSGGWTGEWAWSEQLVLSARLDPISSTMVLLVPAVALPVVLYAAVQEAGRGLTRLMALLLAFVGAMQLLVVADDLLTLLVGWELVGACSWALIGHHWRESAAPRDGTIAFLITRFGDLGLFLAAMVTFAASGAFGFAALDSLDHGTLELAVLGILLAAAAKSAQFPFSLWLFNAMSGPSAVSALLHAATMVAAGAYLVARLHPILDQVAWFGPAAMGLGLATAIAGGLVAVLQAHVKKLLAASTSAHFGLMFVAAGAGYPAVAMLHLVVHAWFKSLLFLAAGVASDIRHTHLLALMGQGPRLPVIALLAACGSAALAGIPPLGAAWTKELIGAGAAHHGHWLAVAVILAGTSSAIYAARWQRLALGTGELTGDPAGARPGRGVAAALAIPAALTLGSALIWLPPLHDAVGSWFGTSLPVPASWERAASLCLVAVALYGGYLLARNRPHLGRHVREAAVANWLGLPVLLERLAIRPILTVARGAAWLDDQVLDGAVLSAAALTRRSSRSSSRADDHLLDPLVDAMAGGFGRLARACAGLAEAVADGAVEGTAQLLGAAGGDTARLETGFAHHYLAGMVVGAAVLAAIMLLT